MQILFLDAAATIGYAYGPAGKCPTSGSIRVKAENEGNEIACGRAARWLIKRIQECRPDLIAIEHPQSSAALRGGFAGDGGYKAGRGSAAATDSQLMLNGALHAIAGAYGIKADAPWPNTIRALVCGKPYAPKFFDPVKKKIVAGDTKKLVADTMKLIGWLPADCEDRDRADACAGFAWCSAVHGRMAPPLVLRA